ncbi:tRNA uridine-5-carboxymethylaminomethyl(34) synthesis GTPase MnmE [Blochmannia endosymbiont of Camponotus (Colobopsis) obliquus]|uniref:tRNA uridine-5-carboxymethylaminomethyl(34) synthesis GTPase MnmE n=1 Tax=Blochmannia endosymbiont of Camponotus (Colobopsis) obliquus TaxID=1505597 RepID=UPI00061A6182|nr:tRNA uridine-5-carboxymethylaminomethyl(34) synthesis GTPase MnmE [Blochmannia endosymbiont of Camponotus (Colobopsis) obliquus]AKC60196.1 tRNA modification GTPase MnmE [Blochmannia endosymbiont of Camponotus (Colobopsis) obliquus]
MQNTDTIVAIATPPGRGSIGIIKISGTLSEKIALTIFKKIPQPRQAELLPFYDNHHNILDRVIVLFFPAPNSFTGEHILEIHGHGGTVILDILLQNILTITSKIRIAHPGEFSRRAFLNNKMDLIQAESIADLINADSYLAAKSASNSLQGIFSKYINEIINELNQLRIIIETDINFPEENINLLSYDEIKNKLHNIIKKIKKTNKKANMGYILKDGLKIVISGEPNAGKSSLLNLLSECEKAIITNIPGTTRDILHEHIYLDGIPFHIIDTAGIRDTNNEIERIGINRAWHEIKNADHILYMIDASKISLNKTQIIWSNFSKHLISQHNQIITIIRNKIDLTEEKTQIIQKKNFSVINLSIKYTNGINLLKKHLKNSVHCYNSGSNSYESNFLARRRHLDLLNKALKYLYQAEKHLKHHTTTFELLAEEIQLAHKELEKITGQHNSSDNLLNEIFSTFCIGK